MPLGKSYYTKLDLRGLFFVAVLAGSIGFIIFVLSRNAKPTNENIADSLASYRSIDSMDYRISYGGGRQDKTDGKEYYAQQSAKELFPFDPNTADSIELLRLGLRPWQVRNIYKYRAKGGVYRSERDFANLYGLTEAQFLELRPYINIDPTYYRPASDLFDNNDDAYISKGEEKKAGEDARKDLKRDRKRDTTYHYSRKIREGEYVVLNMADTNQLKKVPGIGSYYAKRIANYGERLGGYVSVDQLDDIEVPSDVKRYLKVDTTSIKKINVNTSTLEQLKRHPYINYYQARAIVDYRKRYGAIRHIDDLRMNPDMSLEVRERIAPYLEY